MSTAIKRRRGTTVQHSTFIGQLGELTVDTDKKTVVVHDGVKAGGFPLASNDIVNVMSYGAKGDDTTDDRAAIQAALNAGAGKVVIFPKPVSKYKIVGNLNPVSNCHIRGEGYPTIHQTSIRSQSIEIPPSTTNLVIEGLRFETDGAFDLGSAGNSVIDLNSGGAAGYCSNITVRDCIIVGTPITGISMYRATGVRIESCTINHAIGEHGIYLLDTDRVFIRGNRIVGPGVSGNGSNGIKLSGASTQFTISDNLVYSTATYGIMVTEQGGGRPTYGSVANNSIESAFVGMYIFGDNISITGNVLKTPTRNGIEITGSTNVTCVGNVIKGVATAGYHGISVDVDGGTVSGNVITDCPRGIEIGIGCVGLRICDNMLNNTANTGTRAFNLAGPLAGFIPVWIYNNTALGYADLMFYADEYCYEWGNVLSTTQTIPQTRGTSCLKAASVGAGTTAGYMRTNAEVYIHTSEGNIVNKASTDDLWNLGALTTAAGMYAKVALCLSSSAVASIVKGAEANSRNGSKLPWVRRSLAIVGYVQLEPSYAGGALGGAFMSDTIGLQNMP